VNQIDVLIAGAGLAGSRCAETLRAGGFGGRVVVAGEEPHAPYERPALSKEMLTGARAPGDLALREVGFWNDRGIELRLGEALGDIDLRGRRALLGGEPVRWRHLVVATGARARRLGFVPPAANVHHLRGLDDAQALRADLERGGRLVIVGSGFVGAEVASSATALGVEVSMVEALPLPFAATLGPAVGRRLADHYRAEGVELRLGMGVDGVAVRSGRVESVELADGTRLPCAALLVAVGTRPSAEILDRLLPLADDGGVPTDADGATDVPGVHACGDAASPWRPELGRHLRLEHWTAAATGGAAVARAIMGQAPSPAPPPYFWSDQFGWRLQMIGHATPGVDAVVEEREGGFVARYRNPAGAVTAALAVNRPSDLASLRAEVAGAGRAGATAASGGGSAG
jgi:NADPH-dependent 2,4-dienoyl-CoA reductase/sulfur reductase-like enzyme